MKIETSRNEQRIMLAMSDRCPEFNARSGSINRDLPAARAIQAVDETLEWLDELRQQEIRWRRWLNDSLGRDRAAQVSLRRIAMPQPCGASTKVVSPSDHVIRDDETADRRRRYDRTGSVVSDPADVGRAVDTQSSTTLVMGV